MQQIPAAVEPPQAVAAPTVDLRFPFIDAVFKAVHHSEKGYIIKLLDFNEKALKGVDKMNSEQARQKARNFWNLNMKESELKDSLIMANYRIVQNITIDNGCSLDNFGKPTAWGNIVDIQTMVVMFSEHYPVAFREALVKLSNRYIAGDPTLIPELSANFASEAPLQTMAREALHTDPLFAGTRPWLGVNITCLRAITCWPRATRFWSRALPNC
jgi:hypothetical protein